MSQSGCVVEGLGLGLVLSIRMYNIPVTATFPRFAGDEFIE